MPPHSATRTLRLAVLVALLPLLAATGLARVFTVVVYNIENLFDVDGVAVFEDYQPANYGPRQLFTKVTNAATLLARFDGGRGADIIALNEIEIDYTPGPTPPDYEALLSRYADTTVERMLLHAFDRAVADLPAEFFLLKRLLELGAEPYSLVVGDDPPSPPGAERPTAHKNALLTRFPIVHSRSHVTAGARRILEVKLQVDGYPLYLFVNHWKSGASNPELEPIRVGNARVLRQRIDELLRDDPQTDLLIVGDLNSHYNQSQRYREMRETGINTILRSQGNELAVRGPQRDLYNLWYELPPERRASDLFRDEWGTLMHIIVSRGLYDYRGVQYIDNSFGVARVVGFNADALGRPIRWSGEGDGSGFSDHFPLYARFRVVTDDDPNRWLALTRPTDRDETVFEVFRLDYRRANLGPVPRAVDLPAGTNLRDGSWNGRFLEVRARVSGERPFRIELDGQTWEIWSFDEALRRQIYGRYKVGDTMNFIGEVGIFRGRWQFVIRDASWLLR